MGKNVSSTPVTVRLPNELVKVITAQAKAAGESVNLFLNKRIKSAVFAGHDERKTVESDQKAVIDWRLDDDDD